MPAIRQKVRAIAALALVGIAVLLTWRFLPRERLLLARATYVLTVHNPFDPLAGIGGPARRAPAARPALLLYDPYFWKSDKEILTFRPAAGSPLLYEAYCVHLDTGRQDSMPAFNRMLASEMGANALFRGPAGSRFVAIWAHETLQLSPDGHWMLCRYWDLPSARAGQAVISLDGSRRLFWAGSPDDPFLPGRLSPCWLPDSRRWIVIQNTMQNGTEFECTVQIYDLRAPHTVITRKVTLPSDPHYLQMLGITQAGAILMDELLNAARHFGSKLTTKDLILVPLAIGQQDRKGAAALARTYTVKMPPEGSFLEGISFLERRPVLSFQRDRLAWMVTRDYNPPGPAWMKRIEGVFGLRPHTSVGLWVSRLDGSAMQEIGHIAYRPGEEVPQDIQWTPDGKRLSFLYKGALYTVPVD